MLYACAYVERVLTDNKFLCSHLLMLIIHVPSHAASHNPVSKTLRDDPAEVLTFIGSL